MQLSIFDYQNDFKKITKPIRLIELFAGYGSQHLAFKYLKKSVESWKICEWAIKSIQAYKDVHFKEDNTDYSTGLTFEGVIDYLFEKGISANYNEPMKCEQIKRLGEQRARQIYNNIQATHNLVSICNIKGDDLEIVDTNKYEYIITYSYPCQDLSNAGTRKGMGEKTGTRSGLIWEVKRILSECTNLPQILLMENVPAVKNSNNIEDLNKWKNFLKSLGYHNYCDVLNAKDYGIPQNRERFFMISLLEDYYYDFPEKEKLTIKLKDLLEKDVDKKYFLSDKMIKYFIKCTNKHKEKGNSFGFNIISKNGISKTITTKAGERLTDNFIKKNDKFFGKYDEIRLNKVAQIGGYKSTGRIYSADGLSPTLRAADGGGREPKIICENSGENKYELLDKTKTNIRKLTPRECFRLMGVRDNDFENIAKNQSDSSLYHLAGDSIVVNVLMKIFKKLF